MNGEFSTESPQSIEELLATQSNFEAISNYGIDNLDKQNPTVKDKTYRALNAISKGGQARETLQSLLSDESVGEVVKVEDLLATYDALALRLAALKKAGKSNESNFAAMEQKFVVLKDFLVELKNQDNSGVNLSEGGTIDRVTAFEELVKNLAPGGNLDTILNYGYKQLIREAAKVEIYHQNKGKLKEMMERMRSYHPENNVFFKQQLERVSTPDAIGDPFADLPESDGGRIKKEDVVLELTSVLNSLESDGFKPSCVTFFGSLNEGRARSVDSDPDDPSDLDLFVVVPDQNLSELNTEVNSKLGRRREFYGNNEVVTSYAYFVPSATGKVLRAECFVISEGELKKMQSGSSFYEAHPDKRKFLSDALSGRIVKGTLPLS